jgi:glyceraldehyde 3-phosphate dehydrogenase
MGHADALHYLLVRDSVHGSLEDQVKLDGNYFITNGQHVRVLSGGKPGTIPWDTFEVDVVIDATGHYLKREELEQHLEAGAKRVFVTRTPEDEIDRIVIPGINENTIQESDQIISATSSTTQVLALMLKILNQHYTVRRAMMTTVHAYTADQPLADAVGLDLRRSRSAVENIIPNTTGAPEIVEKLIPEFEGKLDGIAFNVPVPNGSCVDLTTDLETMPTVDTMNAMMRSEAENGYAGLIGYTEDPIVSSDVNGREETMIFDAKATMIASDVLLKTICWYDNGWGFSRRILDMIELYAQLEEY